MLISFVISRKPIIHIAGATTVFTSITPVAFNTNAATGASPCFSKPMIHLVFMGMPPLHTASGGTETLALSTGQLIDIHAALLTSQGIRLGLLGVRHNIRQGWFLHRFNANGSQPFALTVGFDRANGDAERFRYALVSLS